MTGSTIVRRRSSGFTLLELTLVSGLTAWLVVLLSSAWYGLGRPSTDALVRCRVAQEASLAADSLARDMGGSLPGMLGGKDDGRVMGHLLVDGSQLWLCYDGGPNPNGLADWADPDTVITYTVDGDRLVRSNLTTGTTMVVATKVDDLTLTSTSDGFKIQLTFTYRDLTRTFEMIAQQP